MCCGRTTRTTTPTTGARTVAAGSGRAATGTGAWLVTRPDGTSVRRTSELGARLAAAAVPGSTIEQTTA